jgi:hypothetical protein
MTNWQAARLVVGGIIALVLMIVLAAWMGNPWGGV